MATSNGSEESHLTREDNIRRLGTSFRTQANAVMRKNITFQQRSWGANCCLLLTPIVLCGILAIIQALINSLLSGGDFQCGCKCLEYDSADPPSCVKTDDSVCGFEYSNSIQAAFCPISSPQPWPAYLQVPDSRYRAQASGLPPNCKSSPGGCPAAFPYTGQNQATADALSSHLLDIPVNQSIPSDIYQAFAEYYPGTSAPSVRNYFTERAFDYRTGPTYFLSSGLTCSPQSQLVVNYANVALKPLFRGVGVKTGNTTLVQCLPSVPIWRNSTADINSELFYGYRVSNNIGQINEYSAAYDWKNTSSNNFHVNIYYNSTKKNDTDEGPPAQVRVLRSMNLVAQAFLRSKIANASLPLLFIKEMPKPGTKLSLDFSSLLGPLFYMWLVQMLFPVLLAALVYEKEKNLRQMMKMHGLSDGPYWLVMYSWFLLLSIAYMIIFLVFGSAIQLKFFTTNSYGIQILFYFLYINTQVAFAFLCSTIFSSTKTATVSGYLWVFGTGLLGQFLLKFFIEDKGFSRGGVFALELIPAFALYRALYEFATYAFIGSYQNTDGMTWSNLSDGENGLRAVFGIIVVEWLVFLLVGYYLDQVVSSGSGVRKHPLFFLPGRAKSPDSVDSRLKKQMANTSQVNVEMERPDVANERAAVEALKDSTGDNVIVCKNLQKVYPGRDGNPDKYAVRGLSLLVPRGECFGMLGPNGAGKTTSINMMVGFLEPSAGTAFIEGLDIRKDMDKIYSVMGVCPQHDLLWESLTGFEHLLFYGRLKNLSGEALTKAVEASLKSVNLWFGGVAHKRAGQYSGGMKRRLSVAISLIGDPLVVYMDEPSTGLDPASRYNLWNVVKAAKKDRAIILTTHSMEEAEALCDRLGIFVDGQFQCIGNPKELTSRYGGTFIFTITTPPEFETDVRRFAESIAPSAKLIYSLGGTQKFELPANEVELSNIFSAVEHAKKHLQIQAWGVANTTLEDVFIKIAKEAQLGDTLA